MSKIGVITPTADQPMGIRLAETYMARQTVQPDVWVVVDDGDKYASLTMGQDHIRRTRDGEGGISLAKNMLAALDFLGASCDVIVIWEHDDWYAPEHITTSINCLAAADITGSKWQRYYNIKHQVYRVMLNVGSALCNTAFKTKIRDNLRRACEHAIINKHYGIDRKFWDSLGNIKKNIHGIDTVVGIKGLPGRPGLGMGHRPTKGSWIEDNGQVVLRHWIGDDAEHYQIRAIAEERV